MPWPTRFIYCINVVSALFSMSQPIVGRAFTPQDTAASAAIAHSVCVPATPDVSKSSIIADICNQAPPANDSPACSDQMTGYIQQSVTETCGQYFRLFADCLVSNDVNPAACSDSLYGYQDCSNYTMQAYAYCGCYYTVPSSLADCANEQLRSQAQDTATAATIDARTTTGPTDSDVVPSAASADREATAAVLPVNEESASPSSQSAMTSPYPQIPSAPTVPNTTSNPTIIKTYTTTSTAAGYTTITTRTLNLPVSTITVYPCPLNANDEPIPPPTPSPSVPASITTSDTSAPHSVLPARPNPAPTQIDTANRSTRGQITTKEPPAIINEIQTSQPGAQPPSPSSSYPSSSTAPFSDLPYYSSGIYQPPSTFPPPPLNTATPSAFLEGAPAGGNGSALCGGCRRRSKILRS